MVDGDKKKFDDALQVKADARKKRDDDEKVAFDYDNKGWDIRIIYEQELLLFKKQKAEICEEKPEAFECTGADEIRLMQETKKNVDRYYFMSPEVNRTIYQRSLELDTIQYISRHNTEVEVKELKELISSLREETQGLREDIKSL